MRKFIEKLCSNVNMSHHPTRDHNTQNGARVREIFRRAKIYPGHSSVNETENEARNGKITRQQFTRLMFAFIKKKDDKLKGCNCFCNTVILTNPRANSFALIV